MEIEQKDDVVTDIRSVKTNKNPDKTLKISFIQNVEDGSHSSMMLTVSNPFKKSQGYSAMTHLMKPDKWIGTSIMSCRLDWQELKCGMM